MKETEWALDRVIYQQGIQLLNMAPVIDLFAFRLNYEDKSFVAYQPDPEAQAVNAFTICWKPYLFYAFPPFSIIPLVLQKIREEHRVGCCSKMACTALVAIPNAHGNSGSSNSPQQREHYIHAQQTRPDPSSVPQVNVTDVPHFRGSFENKGLSEGALSIILSSWRKSTQRQYIPYLNKWHRYCCSRELDSLSATVEGVNFLAVLYDEGIG